MYSNENIFFICSHPIRPKQYCKTLHGCLCFQHGKRGKGDYFARGERAEFTPRKKVGNFHASQQLLSMIVDHVRFRMQIEAKEMKTGVRIIQRKIFALLSLICYKSNSLVVGS